MFLVTTIVEGQACERVDVSGRVDPQQASLQVGQTSECP